MRERERERWELFDSSLTIYFIKIPHLRARFLILLARDLVNLLTDLISFENPPRKI